MGVINIGGGGGGNVPVIIPDTLKNVTMSASTVQPFVYTPQIPLQIELGANDGTNSQAIYEFEISKNGYDTMKFTSSALNASTSVPTYYLTSGYRDILRNWDNTTSKPVYIHSGATAQNLQFIAWPQQVYGFYTYGDTYINGIVLLANVYLDNTVNTQQYIAGGSLKTSQFNNAAGTYGADFKPAPIIVIPETNEFLSPQTKAQEAYLTVLPGQSIVNVDNYRSFDFRTGTTVAYSTFYTSLSNYFGNWLWNYSSMFASGGTVHTTNPPLLLKEYLQTGNGTYGITAKGIIGTVPSPINETTKLARLYGFVSPSSGSYPDYMVKLTSATPGIPFEIKNLIQQRNTVTGGTGYESVFYSVIQPNEIANTTINEANNRMGGFSLVQP